MGRGFEPRWGHRRRLETWLRFIRSVGQQLGYRDAEVGGSSV